MATIKSYTSLKESEDEGIRKALINGFNKLDKSAVWYNGITNGQILDWLEKQAEHANFRNKIQIGDKVTRNRDGVLVNLSQLNRVAKKDEKQGEQKTAWSEEDELHIRKLEGLVKRVWAIAEHENDKDTIHEMSDLSFFLKTLKPELKQEWSEEDERMMMFCCDYLDDNQKSWLLSLKERYTWKPSDEQMMAIQEAMNIVGILTITGSKINSLYQDLKRLREE